MKTIMVHFEDKEYEQVKSRKKLKETWKEFIMRK